MEVALRRGYGYAFGPKIRKRAGFGMGDTCVDYDSEGNCLSSIPDPTLTSVDPSTLYPEPGYNIIPTVDAAGNPLGVPIVDASGVTWSCNSTTGNCCDPNNNCQQGPPSIANASPAGATAAQIASASAANQSNAALIAGIATAAGAAIRAAAAVTGAHVTCPTGVSVPVGTPCPGAAVGSVCPTGYTLNGTTCTQGILGMSTSTLLLIGVAVFALMAIEGGGGGRRR